MENEADLQREYRTTAVVAWAIGASLVVYTIIVELTKFRHHPFTGFSPRSVTPVKDVFLFAVLLVLVIIRKVRSSILKKEKTDTRKMVLNKLKTAAIATFALCEIPAVMGLVIFFMGGLDKEYYILLTCSIVAMFVYFPRFRHWQAFLGKVSSFY